MGRYCLEDDDHNDTRVTTNGGRNWTFVAQEGEEGSLVPYNDSTRSSLSWSNPNGSMPQHYHPQQHQQRPIVYVVSSRHHDWYDDPNTEDDHDSSHHVRRRRGWCGWCGWVGVTLFSLLMVSCWHYGPPAPPPPTTTTSSSSWTMTTCSASLEDTATTTSSDACRAERLYDNDNDNHDKDKEPLSWTEYRQYHTAALLQSLRATVWDTTWHVVSWTGIQVWYDVQSIRQALTQFLHQTWDAVRYGTCCSLHTALSSSSTPTVADLYPYLLEHFPSATAQPHAMLPFVQALETHFGGVSPPQQSQSPQSQSPLVLWASQMTPGLAVPEWIESTLEFLLPHCPRSKRPWAILSVPLVSPMSSSTSRTLFHIPPNDDDEQQQQQEQRALEWIQTLRRTVEPWQGRGGIVLVQQADRLPTAVLEWLLLLGSSGSSSSSFENDKWTLPPTTTSSTTSTQQQQQQRLFASTIVILTSETIGRSSMARHLRLQPSIRDISRSSLVLDIQHEVATHFLAKQSKNNHNNNHKQNNKQNHHFPVEHLVVLPFWYVTRSTVQDDALDVALQRLTDTLQSSGKLSSSSSLAVTHTLRQEWTSPQRMEWIQLTVLVPTSTTTIDTTDSSSSSSSTTTAVSLEISTQGMTPLLDHVRVVEPKVRHCLESSSSSSSKNKHPTNDPSYTLDYDPATQQVVLLQQDCFQPETTLECPPICSFYF